MTVVGISMKSYLTYSAENPLQWTLSKKAIRNAHGNTILGPVNPARVFVGFRHTPLSWWNRRGKGSDTVTGCVRHGTVIIRRIYAPFVYVGGRRSKAAWSGTKAFEEKIVGQTCKCICQRQSENIFWDETPEGISWQVLPA